jgi:hypothetical protein
MRITGPAWFVAFVVAITLGAIVTVILFFGGAFRSPAPAPVNPLCTTAAASALANYWNQQVANASYSQLQNVYFQAEKATDARLNYCKAHS